MNGSERVVNESSLESFTWTHRGPWNVGGRTRALALDISDPTEQTILAGGVSGGMWRSTDGGVFRADNANSASPSFFDITGASMPEGYVSCIAIDPANANNAMVAFSNYEVISLYYTTNGGVSWTAVAGNLCRPFGNSGTINSLVSAPKPTPKPSEFKLAQNYPNPFTPLQLSNIDCQRQAK